MDKITVHRDMQPDLRFAGQLIAQVGTKPTTGKGEPGRWTELHLYRTDTGRYVCVEIGRTEHRGEHHRHRAEVVDDIAGVQAYFKHGWLAKELYRKAGIDAVEEI